jgi:hypothetical protein
LIFIYNKQQNNSTVMSTSTFGSYGLGTAKTKNINFYGGTINGYLQRGLSWADIEPTQSSFTFTALDNAIDACISSSISMSLMIYVGPDAPDWIYEDAGVPVVYTSGSSSLEPDEYPYYLDETYQDLTETLWTNVASHIAGWSTTRKKHLAFWQVAEGAKGDSVPYHGTVVDDTYAIYTEDWVTEKRRIWTLFDELNRTIHGQNPGRGMRSFKRPTG